MYITRSGQLTGVNRHPGNYANLSGDEDGECQDAGGFGTGAGMPYGLGAFLTMKDKSPSGRRPVLPQIMPHYATARNVYPDRGVPVKKTRFNPAVRRLKGV